MNIDSALNQINKHLRDVFDMFGGQSEEYMNALTQARETIPEEVLQQTARKGLNYAYDMPTEPLQISRSKTAKDIYSTFESELSLLRTAQKATGTAKVQSQKYIKELVEKGIQPSIEYVRKQANELYRFRNTVNEWYTEAMKSEELTEEDKADIKADYSELSGSDYEEYNILRKNII